MEISLNSKLGNMRGAYRILAAKYFGKISLARAVCRWVGNIKMDHQDVEWRGMDWSDLVQHTDRWRVLVNAVLNLRVRENGWNFLTS